MNHGASYLYFGLPVAFSEVVPPDQVFIRSEKELVKIVNLANETKVWQQRIKELEAMHDAQRRDLQGRNTELVERARAAEGKLARAEAILGLMRSSIFMNGYFISLVSVLAQPKETQDYLNEILRDAETRRPPEVKSEP